MSVYHTIKENTSGTYKEKGSKFYAYAYGVNTKEEVQKHLTNLKKEYHDARHFCYAYVLGMKSQEVRANDDGEPNHSAGDPILGQIKSFKLTNVLIVVVRYFGGTKLGVGGLIHAYKSASESALSTAKLLEIYPEVHFRIVYSYDQTTLLERLLSSFDLRVEEKEFSDRCMIRCSIREDNFPRLLQKNEPPSQLKIELLDDKLL